MKLSDSCYMVTGLSGPGHWVPISGFVTGAEKTLVIDTGMTYMSARTIFGYARAVRPGNEMMVAVTEPHFDHIGGNCFFQEQGINIYAHRGVNRPIDLIDTAKKELNRAIEDDARREANEEEAYYLNTRIVNPDKSVNSGDVFDLGGRVVEVIGTPGHTPFNLSYMVTDEKVLYCGDAIVTHYIPNLGEGDPEAWKVWQKSLDKIEAQQPAIVVPGHGDFIKGSEIPVAVQRIREILQKAIVPG